LFWILYPRLACVEHLHYKSKKELYYRLKMNTIIQIDKLVRSNRRTLRLSVSTDAKLTVKAPLHCSNKIIQQAVKKHEDWILRRMKYAQEHFKPASSKKYVSGEAFLYLGKAYKLVISEVCDVPFTFDGLNFILDANYVKCARELFIRWYIQKAFKTIAERASLYSYITGMKYKKVKITNAQHRWGSCSGKGNLNFTWSLIMAPVEVIDCVVVHELVHIKVKGHRNGFWEMVKTYIPDLESRRNWLRENQNLVSI
jgi:predicted metal-dependent hydrolase